MSMAPPPYFVYICSSAILYLLLWVNNQLIYLDGLINWYSSPVLFQYKIQKKEESEEEEDEDDDMMMSNKKKVEETDPIARELIGLVQTGFNLLKQVLKLFPQV